MATPNQTCKRPTPTKEHNNITSKLNYYEDINTKKTPKTPVKPPPIHTTTKPRNTTDTIMTTPTQHPHNTHTNTQHHLHLTEQHKTTTQTSTPKTQSKSQENHSDDNRQHKTTNRPKHYKTTAQTCISW